MKEVVKRIGGVELDDMDKISLKRYKSQLKGYLKEANMSWSELKARIREQRKDVKLKDAVVKEHKCAYCAAGLHEKCKGKFLGSSRKCECGCQKQ